MDQQDAERQKKAAGEAAAALVQSGMRIGLGTGSTARYVVEALGRRLANDELEDIIGVPTSIATERLAMEANVPLAGLETLPQLDLTIDGADEISPDLALTKGGGGALVREKIVAAASKRMVVISDDSKMVERLGTRLPLPIAVVPFGWHTLVPKLDDLGMRAELRCDDSGSPFVSDDGLFVLDCNFTDGIEDPARLDSELARLPGVVTSGLFIGMAERALVAGPDGVRVYVSPPSD